MEKKLIRIYPSPEKATFREKITGNSDRVNYLFQMTEPYERAAGKDLCRFSAEELAPILAKHFGTKRRTVTHAVNLIHSYSRWCCHRGAIAEAIRLDFPIDPMDRIRATQYASPYHLLQELDLVFMPEEIPTRNILYRAFFWLAYAGVPDEDALNLTRDLVDFRRMTVHLDDRDCPLVQEGAKDLDLACGLTEFLFKYVKSTPLMSPRKTSDLVLRGTKEDRVSLSAFRSNISNRTGAAGSNLSYHNVMLSGIYYRMLQREMAGFDPEPAAFAPILWTKDTEEQKGSEALRKRKQKRIEKDITTGYEAWKQAFL